MRLLKTIIFLSLVNLIFGNTLLFAQGFPNIDQPAAGTLLQGPIDHQMGRLAIIEYLGGYVITIPEAPGSEATDHLRMKAWDISNPRSVRQHQQFRVTSMPGLAHSTFARDNCIFVGGWPNDAICVDENGNFDNVPWPATRPHWNKSGLMHPWAAKHYWAYNAPNDDAWIDLDGQRMATWNHLALTGVQGFPAFMGNLLIYASDQSNTGIATYDVSDPTNPVLLDVLNTPATEGGIGGYWSEIHSHYMVFARRWGNGTGRFAGIQVVDFSDPTDLRLHCNIDVIPDSFPGAWQPWWDRPEPMYVGFQDEFIFSERYKVNIETCEYQTLLEELDNGIDTSQYSLPMGNLLVTGGYPLQPGTDGMAIWVHQQEADNRAPYVGYHIPRAGQTNYPLMAPISFMIPEKLRPQTIVVTETAEPGEAQTITITKVGGDPIRLDYIISHTGILTVDPVAYLEPDSTYEVRLTSGILDAAGNAMEEYTFRFATGDTIDQEPDPDPPNSPPVIENVAVTPPTGVQVGEIVEIRVTASDVQSMEYQFEVSGQNADWSPDNSSTFQFDQVGTYAVNVRVRDSLGAVSPVSRVEIVVTSASEPGHAGLNSSQLSCDASSDQVWVVNPDNDTIAIVQAGTLQLVDEVSGSDDPRAIAKASDDTRWVTAHDSDSVDVYSASADLLARLNTGYGSAPYGVVAGPDGTTVYVSLYGSGEIVRFDVASRSETARWPVGPTPRALALSPDGSRLFITRFMSALNWAEVWEIDTTSGTLAHTFRLHKHLIDDGLEDGRGVPNYLSDIIVNGSGEKAYVVAKKDNTDRGLLNGLPLDLDDDNTVRTLLMTIDLDTRTELRGQRFDFDNAASPSALALSPQGDIVFVAMQDINQVFAMSVGAAGEIENRVAQIAVGHAPQGLCINGEQLFAKNLTDRSISAVDISGALIGADVTEVTTVANEKMPPDVLDGKRIFYDAANDLLAVGGKMSAEGYISCATCHIDGDSDGRSYDFTGRGEGYRNNISLLGRGGVRFGNVHWSANFDEIQDFEHDIRNAFRGRGFMSDEYFAATDTPLGGLKAGLSEDLDKLAAYVSSLGRDSLPRSPHRQDNGDLTAAAVRGQQVFADLGCASCHQAGAFTDGTLHNIGTLRTYSGGRLGGALPGIKTPSLLGLFATAPYLHDGSAETIVDVFSTFGGTVHQAETGDLSNGAVVVSHLDDSFSYLREGRGVRLTAGASITLANVDGGSGGEGLIRLRIGSSQGGTLTAAANGTSAVIALGTQPTVESADVNFIETAAIPIDLQAGDNTVVLTLDDNGGGVIVDDATVTTADTLEVGSPHSVAMNLSAGDSNDLSAYLLQIDQRSAPDDAAPVILGDRHPPTVVMDLVVNGQAVSADGGGSFDSTGDIVDYTWQWGDGTSDQGASAEHVFEQDGNYTVTLTVLDAAGNSAALTESIAIETGGPGEPDDPDAGGGSLSLSFLMAMLILFALRRSKRYLPRST
ncbi:PKD domain-containing protein [Exilibacterium tricleocarpae]|uniref:PKD domain-containing protein n=1 Tax=Exilibacterium tricleocarpae TaxID=2591008 RepID=A0A545TNV8_9GAMM|nr:PKD domain-containing protein [Exilibacterium tricleocarpae]TQV78904.1 PKD domain-containing protein [Exilibacterium tricleocarpae]